MFYKHYIRINENNIIIKVFSDAFEISLKNDILLYETITRHCFFNIYTHDKLYKYKYISGEGNTIVYEERALEELNIEREAAERYKLRINRNILLQDSDWTQLLDIPFNTGILSEWQIYRQALRDLPSNTIDLFNPIWPEIP